MDQSEAADTAWSLNLPHLGKAAESAAAVDVRDVSKWYESQVGVTHALDDVSFAVPRNQFVSIVGASGCGKSTLLDIIGGLTPASAGTVSVGGHVVTGPQTGLGYVFQAPTLLGWRSAMDNVLLQAEAKKMDMGKARARATNLLASVGLDGFENRRPRELSGGMQQRVAICRALVHDPDILLFDEPFAALDAITRDEMGLQLELLLMQEARTIVFVTHSIPEAVFLSDRVIVMSKRPGRIVDEVAVAIPRPRPAELREDEELLKHVRKIRAAL